MSPAEFLAALRARGVELKAMGDGRVWCTPANALTPADREMIVGMKSALLGLLEQADDDVPVPASPCATCWRPFWWATDAHMWVCLWCGGTARCVTQDEAARRLAS